MVGEEQTDSSGKYGMNGSSESNGPKWWPVSLKIAELVCTENCHAIAKAELFSNRAVCAIILVARQCLHWINRRSGQQSTGGDLCQFANARRCLHDIWGVHNTDGPLCDGQIDPGHVSNIVTGITLTGIRKLISHLFNSTIL